MAHHGLTLCSSQMYDLSLYRLAMGCWTNPVALLAASLALAPSKVAHSLFADKPCACWFAWLLVQPLLGSCSRMCFSKFKNCKQRLRSSDSWLSSSRRTVDFKKRKLKALQTRSPNCRTDCSSLICVQDVLLCVWWFSTTLISHHFTCVSIVSQLVQDG